ncbi:MAG: hypothetical protein NT007_14835 [Candidatus Kapabacteria bacterium]|nr:hypothetical protein [Candidatus Kapabacteria bacterium]
MNLLLKKFILYVSLFLIVCNSQLLSDQKISNPLVPGDEPLKREIGVYFGLGYNYSGGAFFVDCKTCSFKKPWDYGFSLGGVFLMELMENLTIGAKLGYDYRTLTSKFIEIDPVILNKVDVNNKQVINKIYTNLSFNYLGSASFNYFEFIPFVQSNVKPFLFRLGVYSGIVAKGHIIHTIEPIDRVKLLSDGTLASISFIDDTTKNIGYLRSDGVWVRQDSDFPKIKTLQFALMPAMGLNLSIGKGFYFSPTFEYFFPLNTLSDNGNNFSVQAWRINLELRYDLTYKKPKK